MKIPRGRFLMGMDLAKRPDETRFVLVPVVGNRPNFLQAISMDEEQMEAFMRDLRDGMDKAREAKFRAEQAKGKPDA